MEFRPRPGATSSTCSVGLAVALAAIIAAILRSLFCFMTHERVKECLWLRSGLVRTKAKDQRCVRICADACLSMCWILSQIPCERGHHPSGDVHSFHDSLESGFGSERGAISWNVRGLCLQNSSPILPDGVTSGLPRHSPCMHQKQHPQREDNKRDAANASHGSKTSAS